MGNQTKKTMDLFAGLGCSKGVILDVQETITEQ